MNNNKDITSSIIIIGNEILSGRTQDKNVIFICNWLNSECGISVEEVRIIPDVEKTIIKNRFLFINACINLIYIKFKKKGMDCHKTLTRWRFQIRG